MRRERQRGQALVEFTLVVPLILVLLTGAVELGLIFGKLSSLGYASREGARAGAALVTGGVTDCSEADPDPPVDVVVVAAAQRILTSPDSGIDLGKVEQIRIFKADGDGSEIATNVWTPGVGALVDPEDPTDPRLKFVEVSAPWPACARNNTRRFGGPESIGVTLKYRYEFVTPVASLVNAVAGGRAGLDSAKPP